MCINICVVKENNKINIWYIYMHMTLKYTTHFSLREQPFNFKKGRGIVFSLYSNHKFDEKHCGQTDF